MGYAARRRFAPRSFACAPKIGRRVEGQIVTEEAANRLWRARWPEMDPVVPGLTVGLTRWEQDVRTFSLDGLSIQIDDIVDVVETKKRASSRSHNEVLSGVVGLRSRFGMFIKENLVGPGADTEPSH